MAFYIMAQLPSLIGATIPPSSTSSSIHQERQALLHSGWWNDHPNNSHHCDWEGISCNEAGSVTGINRTSLKNPSSKELLWIHNLNFTAFSNLVYLGLIGMGLRGTIPTQISLPTNLTYLVLSHNRLQGMLLLHAILKLEFLLIALSLFCAFIQFQVQYHHNSAI